jgi:elongation factor Ts
VAEITARAVKTLRDQTGAGMMDCKRVLQDAEGDLKRAAELLRERGLAKAGKREGRVTSEGVVAIALSGAAGAIVELGCETDFVARTDEFVRLAESLAQVAAVDSKLNSAERLLDAEIDGEKVRERVTAAIAKLGENVVVKRAERIAVDGPGVVNGYVHAGGKLAVIVALATSASGAEIESLAKDLAMHIAAADPTPVAVSRDDVAPDLIDSERSIYRKQAAQEGKPEKVIDRIVEGRINKFLSEVALLEQAFVKNPDCSVAELLRDAGGRAGSDIAVAAFRRFRLGEALEE